MNSYNDPTTVTAAQETITSAMLAALLACAVASYTIATYLALTTPLELTILAISTFVVAGYVVPNLTAVWIGRPLAEIMQPEPSTETEDFSA